MTMDPPFSICFKHISAPATNSKEKQTSYAKAQPLHAARGLSIQPSHEEAVQGINEAHPCKEHEGEDHDIDLASLGPALPGGSLATLFKHPAYSKGANCSSGRWMCQVGREPDLGAGLRMLEIVWKGELGLRILRCEPLKEETLSIIESHLVG